MKKVLILVAAAAASIGTVEVAFAQTAAKREFLCGAQASQKRLLPGSEARKTFMQQCMASSLTPAAAPPQPKATERPAARPIEPARPGGSKSVSDGKSQATSQEKLAFACGAQASQQRLLPGSEARNAFIRRCIATARPPRKD